MNDGRARDWWELVEEHLTRGDHELIAEGEPDDPWSDDGAAPALTDAQRTLLGGIDDDQPPVPRFKARHEASDTDATDDDASGPTTGNIPGDTL